MVNKQNSSLSIILSGKVFETYGTIRISEGSTTDLSEIMKWIVQPSSVIIQRIFRSMEQVVISITLLRIFQG